MSRATALLVDNGRRFSGGAFGLVRFPPSAPAGRRASERSCSAHGLPGSHVVLAVHALSREPPETPSFSAWNRRSSSRRSAWPYPAKRCSVARWRRRWPRWWFGSGRRGPTSPRTPTSGRSSSGTASRSGTTSGTRAATASPTTACSITRSRRSSGSACSRWRPSRSRCWPSRSSRSASGDHAPAGRAAALRSCGPAS